MVEENKPDNLEMEKIELERFKVLGRIITAAITVVFGSGIAAFINYQIQTRQLDQQNSINQNELELQKKKAEADQRQAEMKYLGEFVDHALTDDHTRRLRFAEYFAKLTISDELQKKWIDYHDGISNTIKLLDDKKVELASADNEVEKERISAEVFQLQAQLDPLPKKSKIEIACEKVGLNKRRRPLKYTENEYDLRNEEQVVYDKATDLTWQQSGSDKSMNYERAKTYIKKINSDKVAGYSDWRLPTIKEATTLLEQERKSNGFFIDPVFDKKQKWIWTSDMYSTASAWVVAFDNGICYGYNFKDHDYVRAVR